MKRLLLLAVLAVVIVPAATTAADPLGIDYSCSPAPCDGWHTTPVTITWTPIGGSLDCSPREPVSTEGITKHTCSVTPPDNSGSASRTVVLSLDLTPPTVTGATVSRLPDHNGWYRAPVQVTYSGTDATSGLRGCSSVTYGGPDADPANVGGTCTDVAGNVSAVSVFPLRYDATAPAIAAPQIVTGDRIVRLHFTRPADAATFEVVRSPGRHGAAATVVDRGSDNRLLDREVRNGHRYRYTLRATDAAGNTSQLTVSAVPDQRLLGPAGGAVLQSPPVLRWTAVRGARYYNVQLFRGSHKVLSAWPRRAQLRLTRSWRYAGRHERLRPGRYAWYVWPGRGRPADRRYGPPIGHARFVVAR